MINNLINWLEENEGTFEKLNITVEKVSDHTDSENKSYTISHCSDFYIGQIVMWDRGHMEIEVYCIETGDRVFYVRLESTVDVAIDAMLEAYVKVMSNENPQGLLHGDKKSE